MDATVDAASSSMRLASSAFFSVDARLLFVDRLLVLNLGAQVLGLLHHLCVALVDLGQHVPVGGEGLEARGAQQQVEHRGAARAVHGAGPVAQMLLHLGYLPVQLVDARLGGIAVVFGLLLLGERLAVIGRGLIELLLHGVQRGEGSLGLGLFLGRCQRTAPVARRVTEGDRDSAA